MTLEIYTSDRLDRLSLRVLDLAATFRSMSQQARDLDIEGIELHDKKSSIWLANLEQWAIEADSKLQALAIKQRGARRAASASDRTTG